jgi:hypothetical protein
LQRFRAWLAVSGQMRNPLGQTAAESGHFGRIPDLNECGLNQACENRLVYVILKV